MCTKMEAPPPSNGDAVPTGWAPIDRRPKVGPDITPSIFAFCVTAKMSITKDCTQIHIVSSYYGRGVRRGVAATKPTVLRLGDLRKWMDSSDEDSSDEDKDGPGSGPVLFEDHFAMLNICSKGPNKNASLSRTIKHLASHGAGIIALTETNLRTGDQDSETAIHLAGQDLSYLQPSYALYCVKGGRQAEGVAIALRHDYTQVEVIKDCVVPGLLDGTVGSSQ